MEKQAEKWYNRYQGTLVFFPTALFATLNTVFFPYTIIGKLCALLWLFSFTFAMFASEYTLSHAEIKVKTELRYMKTVVILGIWLIGLVTLVLFVLILNK